MTDTGVVEKESLRCPKCGSEHIVAEGDERLLCLFCNSMLKADSQATLRPVGLQCAHCGTDNVFGGDSCFECGRSLRQDCLKCAVPLAVWREVCSNCGTNQAAYQEQIAAEALAAQQARQPASRSAHWRGQQSYRRRGFWRWGWMIWLFFWGRYLIGAFGDSLRWLEDSSSGLMALLSGGEVSGQLVSIAVGLCVFGVGGTVFLLAALPSYIGRAGRNGRSRQ